MTPNGRWALAVLDGPDGPRDIPGSSAPAGRELLDRLRDTGHLRPSVDPSLAVELRRRLDSGVADAAGDLVRSTLPLRVTKARLAQVFVCEAHVRTAGDAPAEPTLPLARGALVDALFRQLVTTGSLGDPMCDGRDALAVDGRQAGLVAFIDGLPPASRVHLAAEVEQQAAGLRDRWPALRPAWFPRTQEPMVASAAGGRILLSARVDLALGGPADDRASVCLVELKSGHRRLEHRSDLHFCALLETLRCGAPPFAAATYYARTGDLEVEPITADLLLAACSRIVAGTVRLCRLAAGAPPATSGSPACASCRAEHDEGTRTSGTGPPLPLGPNGAERYGAERDGAERDGAERDGAERYGAERDGADRYGTLRRAG